VNEKYNLAIFRSFRPWLNKDSKSVPGPTQGVIPEWYKNADRFAKMPNGEYYKAPKEVCPFPKEGTVDDYGKIPTWKACPAIMDAFSTGYVFKTPCDLTFFKNTSGIIDVKIEDNRYGDFCTRRQPMPQFEHPKGFYRYHFAWMADWGLELPEGYSALFMTPMNRFDLPFMNTTGVVDSDKVHLLGSFPFFIAEGWEGTIPAGTPYLQVIPFKRENWEHKVEILDQSEMYGKLMDNAKFYRQPDGGIYKNKVWSRREYR
jgi:hypothetical protein